MVPEFGVVFLVVAGSSECFRVFSVNSLSLCLSVFLLFLPFGYSREKS